MADMLLSGYCHILPDGESASGHIISGYLWHVEPGMLQACGGNTERGVTGGGMERWQEQKG